MSIHRWTPLFLVVALSSPVQAVTLPQDGSFAALPGTSVAAQPKLAGTVVEDELTPFNLRLERVTGETLVNWDLTGTVQSQVIRAVDGTFDFYWRVLPDAQYRVRSCAFECVDSIRTSPVPISNFVVSSFSAPEYRADWRSDGPGEAAPRQAQRLFLGSVPDDGVNFSFARIVNEEIHGDSALVTGINSYSMFIDTDAPAYSKSGQFRLTTFDDVFFPGPESGGGAASCTPPSLRSPSRRPWR